MGAFTPNEGTDGKNPKTANTSSGFGPPTSFTRGVTTMENLIVAGTNSGEIMLITCNSESSFKQQNKSVKEHNMAITDLVTCAFDYLTVSGDVGGNLVVWTKGMKGVAKKISTNQRISVLNILRRQVFCGTYMGQILVFSISTGALVAEMNAHSRQINAISVAVESAYILTASEDCYLRVWKLYSRNPENYRIEHRWSMKIENCTIVGAKFATNRGTSFMVSQFEGNQILAFKIGRKAAGEKKPDEGEATKPEIGLS